MVEGSASWQTGIWFPSLPALPHIYYHIIIPSSRFLFGFGTSGGSKVWRWLIHGTAAGDGDTVISWRTKKKVCTCMYMNMNMNMIGGDFPLSEMRCLCICHPTLCMYRYLRPLCACVCVFESSMSTVHTRFLMFVRRLTLIVVSRDLTLISRYCSSAVFLSHRCLWVVCSSYRRKRGQREGKKTRGNRNPMKLACTWIDAAGASPTSCIGDGREDY